MSSSTKSPRRFSPIQRMGKGFLVGFQFFLFLVVIISANYLSCARHKRIDLTERKDFTLSDLSKKIIQGDAIQKRDTPVRIIALIRRSSPHYSRIRNLLDEYQRIAKKSITLEFIDPARQTDRTLEIANTYNQPYTEDMIIIDGRSNDTLTTNNGVEESKQQKLSAHVRTTKVKNLYIEDIDQFKQRYIAAWQDEDVISSSILGAIEGTPRKFYFATDKSNLEASDGNPAWKILANMLWQQNIILAPMRLADAKSIPKDAEGLALIAPQYDLDERELKMLTEYWDRPQSAILVTLDPNVQLDNLRIFLRNYGITPRNDRVMTVESKQALSNARALFTRGPEINYDLGGKSTVFDGSSCSLEIRENDDKLMNRRIIPLALVRAADGWWGETRYKEEAPDFNKEEDNAAPIYLAGAVVRGQATSDATANLISKMIVISNTDFLSSKNTRPEQVDFVKSSTNWLVGREELIGVGPRKLYRNKLTLLDAHTSFINRVLLIFLPAFAILISLIVWNIRRV